MLIGALTTALGLADDDRAVRRVGRQQLGVGADRATIRPSTRKATSSTASSISGLDGGDHGGPAGAVLAQPGGDPGLGVGVDRAGRLDQHQDLGVGGERAGQHQPLPLAAGEGPAPLGDLGVQALGQRLEDVLGRRGVERRLDARRAADDVEPVGEPAGEQRRRRCRTPRSGGGPRRGAAR